MAVGPYDNNNYNVYKSAITHAIIYSNQLDIIIIFVLSKLVLLLT